MNSRNRDVRRIHGRFGRNRARYQKGLGQSHRIRGSVKDQDSLERRQPFSRTNCISTRSLLDNADT